MVSRVLEITSAGSFTILDRPVPKPAADEVVVRVEAVTTCPQWDMHLWRGEPMFPGHPVQYPIQHGMPGHEMVGVVHSLGSSVKELSVGQRVAAWRDSGTEQGAYATHTPILASLLLPVPAEGSASKWASLELATCIGSVFVDLQDHGFLPCRRLLVGGLGPAGLLAVQIARAVGVEEIVGIELNPARRRLAEQLGCLKTIDPRESSLPSRRSPDAFDVAIDCVGSENVVDDLAGSTRDVVALFGVQRKPYLFKPEYYTLPPLRLWGYPSTQWRVAEFVRQLVLDVKLDMSVLCTHEVPLREYDRAVSLLLSGEAIKVCILCDQQSV